MGFLFLSACTAGDRQAVDRLNGSSYAYHYRNLDSAQATAQRAYGLAAHYPDGRAEALNNLAFVSMARMDYATASAQLDEADKTADGFVELYVTAIQQMRLCQRRSANREFYDYRERADRCLRRINESRSSLSPRQLRRLAYAESEYAIVSSAYFYYVGLKTQSVEAIAPLMEDIELQHDTAQYLNLLYNVGAGGIINERTKETTAQMEFELLAQCFFLARESGCTFFVAQSLEALAEHLQDSSSRVRLVADNQLAVRAIAPDVPDDCMIAGWMADVARGLFATYGDVYQTAGAERTLASCHMAMGDYATAVGLLEKTLETKRVSQAPDLVASIREQLSVAYAAVGNKAASDLNRNVYLDLQEGTRQDRQLEARAEALERTSRQLNGLIALVALSICALVFLLWLFNRLYHKSQRERGVEGLLRPLQTWSLRQKELAAEAAERREAMEEKRDLAQARREEGARLNAENRAKLSLVASVVPLIDRMLHEMRQLESRHEDEATRQDRLDYVAALAEQIDHTNGVLTQWIQLRGGQLRLHVESFALQPIFDIVAKSRASFKAAGVELHIEPSEATVKADRVLTLFMVNTLADNARKFTPRGGRVTISVKEEAEHVEISVADTGRGMTEEQLSGIFDHKIYNGHGFGLMNCRGIIDKYRKSGKLFACCLLAAESKQGKGSRFFFRLPRGVARLAVGLVSLFASLVPSGASAQEALMKAAAFADSAYYSNIAATYSRTLDFADSCRSWLNRHYQRQQPKGVKLMLAVDTTDDEPAELAWLRDSVATNYEVILDIRNETAVAALALKRWDVYEYNNKAYTQLYKERAADRTLPGYCGTMQRSQANKTVAVVLCILALLMVLPAYYILYYRHILHYRLCLDRVNALNDILQGDEPSATKLQMAKPLFEDDYPAQLREVVESVRQSLLKAADDEGRQATDISELADQQARAEYESARHYVANATLDNALSTLKHETMYYPSRIAQLTRGGEPSLADLRETVDYYHDIYLTLSLQAAHQLQGIGLSIRQVEASAYASCVKGEEHVAGDRAQLDQLFATLRSLCMDEGYKTTAEATDDGRYIRFTVEAKGFKDKSLDTQPDPFTPTVASIPLLVCRQIVREHSEATGQRGCGIAVASKAEGVEMTVTLPNWKHLNQP